MEMYELHMMFGDGELMTEGANLEMHKILKDFKKWKKENNPSDIKALYNAGKYEECRKKIADAKKVCDNYKKLISQMKSGVVPAVIGTVYAMIIEGLKLWIVSIPTFGVGGAVMAVNDAAKTSHEIFKLKQDSKDFDWSNENGYKATILKTISDVQQKLDDVDKACVAALRGDNDEPKTESAMDAVIESVGNGQISDDEAAMLIEALN